MISRHRKEAEALDGIEASYIFDLDGREDRDHSGDDADMFSVGAYYRGQSVSHHKLFIRLMLYFQGTGHDLLSKYDSFATSNSG